MYEFLNECRPTTLAAIVADTKRNTDINVLAWRLLVANVGQAEAALMAKEAAENR